MNQSGGGIWQGIAIGSLVLAALSMVVAVVLPGPQGDVGPTGAQGPQGDQGIQGPQGEQGPEGLQGPPGTDGTDGTNCWDLNGNGIGDPAEDINGDLTVDVNDCTGADGAQGPQGDPGPQGPPGPGSLISVDVASTTTTIGSSCTAYVDAMVTITVPSDGIVVVSAQVQLRINHTQGTEDRWWVSVSDTPTDCDGTVFAWVDTIPQDAATDSSIDRSAYAQRWFGVSAGTYDYYIVGIMAPGQIGDDVFWYANMVAVFYPS